MKRMKTLLLVSSEAQIKQWLKQALFYDILILLSQIYLGFLEILPQQVLVAFLPVVGH